MSLRLDKSGARAVCGVIDCGARIGRIHTQQGPRILVLMPGYRRAADGVFRITSQAASRLRHGQPPRPRSRPFPDGLARDPVPSVLGSVRPCCLPVRVKCYQCGQVNEVTNEALRTENHPHRRELRRGVLGGGSEIVRFGPDDHTDYLEAWLLQFMARE